VTDKTKAKSIEAPAANAKSGDANPRAWFDALEYVVATALKQEEAPRATTFVNGVIGRVRAAGMNVPPTISTPYLNTIPTSAQPAYPGDWALERRIKSLIRWNAMAMVVNANREHGGSDS